ncbi:MAG: S8 family peptidase [Caulobacterales bacterium]
MVISEDPAQTPSEPTPVDIRKNLAKTRVAPDLQAWLKARVEAPRSIPADAPCEVIIEFNSNFPGGPRAARRLLFSAYVAAKGADAVGAQDVTLEDLDLLSSSLPVLNLVSSLQSSPLHDGRELTFTHDDELDLWKSMRTQAYAFGRLTPETLFSLADAKATDEKTGKSHELVHKIWRDHEVSTFIYESVRTIKCDAARTAFGSAGKNIVWAVADTGIACDHPHFATHETLSLPNGLKHCDFTQTYANLDLAEAAALTDVAGHGTHVAGIIAGGTFKPGCPGAPSGAAPVTGIAVVQEVQTGDQDPTEFVDESRDQVSGIAPFCKLMSLKVLATERSGNVSNILAAIGYIQQINDHGRDIKVHGLNMSLGYPFDASWFAAGQSPLCSEVDRLVKCGVVVVVAAGNAGYGRVTTSYGVPEAAALTCTVADPGNAELAITVGSTHRDRPHAYGVSYFSAKGPTADGRMKPDLVAPGERIVSCSIEAADAGVAKYRQDSGTSMAAPHVSAAVAAFLSVRAEFIGKPEAVKDIFLRSAMDLKRRPEFQGAGLIDLMKALQSV